MKKHNNDIQLGSVFLLLGILFSVVTPIYLLTHKGESEMILPAVILFGTTYMIIAWRILESNISKIVIKNILRSIAVCVNSATLTFICVEWQFGLGFSSSLDVVAIIVTSVLITAFLFEMLLPIFFKLKEPYLKKIASITTNMYGVTAILLGIIGILAFFGANLISLIIAVVSGLLLFGGIKILVKEVKRFIKTMGI